MMCTVRTYCTYKRGERVLDEDKGIYSMCTNAAYATPNILYISIYLPFVQNSQPSTNVGGRVRCPRSSPCDRLSEVADGRLWSGEAWAGAGRGFVSDAWRSNIFLKCFSQFSSPDITNCIFVCKTKKKYLQQ